jgi:Spy/CpxP family protein refolding chaperone
MKRLVCAALAAALLVPGMWAVSARAHDERSEEQEDHHEMGEQAKKKLGLTDEQAGKFKDAMKAHHDAMKPIGEKLKAGIKTLRDQVKAKASDDDLKATIASLKAVRQEMTAEQEKFHDSLASFLTPAQQAKMILGMAKRMHERMKGHDGRGGDKPASKDKDDDHEDDKGE